MTPETMVIYTVIAALRGWSSEQRDEFARRVRSVGIGDVEGLKRVMGVVDNHG